jgi:hypothetical protein
MGSFDRLCGRLTDRMLRGGEISLVGAPIIGLKTRHTTWSSALFPFDEPCVCMRSQDISQDRATVLVNRLPSPPLMPCVANIAPHLSHLSLVRWLNDDVHVLWYEVPSDGLMHVVQLWFLFYRNQTTKPLAKATISCGMTIANSLKSFNKLGTLPTESSATHVHGQ